MGFTFIRILIFGNTVLDLIRPSSQQPVWATEVPAKFKVVGTAKFWVSSKHYYIVRLSHQLEIGYLVVYLCNLDFLAIC